MAWSVAVTPIQKNTLANYVGAGWSALMGLISVPFYIKFMGMEAYGLVGVYFTLEALFRLLDLGLSTTLNRELALLSVSEGTAQESRDLTRTLEIIYWGIGILIALVVIACAGFISTRWVKAEQLSPAAVTQVIACMGGALALQWPSLLYEGGLHGLQKQVLWNGVVCGGITTRVVGAMLVLWLVSPTVQAFFWWLILANGLQTAAMALALWRVLPATSQRSRFRHDILSRITRFSAGITGIALLSTVLTQVDKVILSKFVTLEVFGHYMVAASVASILFQVVSPVRIALFPRFSQLLACHDHAGLGELYHKGSQLIAVLTLPITAVLAAFASKIIFLWTGNEQAAFHAGPILMLLAIGTGIQAQLHVPGALQLAYGWTTLILGFNAVAVCLVVPLLIFLVPEFGGQGAAMVWIMYNLASLLIAVPIMHTRVLSGEFFRWFMRNIGYPGIVAIILVGLCWYFIPPQVSRFKLFVCLLGTQLVAVTGAFLAAPLALHEAMSALGNVVILLKYGVNIMFRFHSNRK